MANRDLLKEAIADAKALKETAIANAKAALEEAFEPRLKSMLSAKLQEMDDEDEKNSTEEAKMTEAKKEYKDDDRKDGGRSKETKRTEKMKYGKDLAEGEEMDEMDLDEILAELDEDARTDAEEEGYKDGMEDEKEDMDDMEDEDIDLEDMSEDDLKSFIEDVIADMVTAGELEAGEDFETEDEDEIDVEDDDDIDVEDDTEVDVEVNEEMRKDDMDETHTAMHGKDDMDEEMRKDDMDEGIMDRLKAAYNDKELMSKIVTVDGKKVSMKDLLSLAGSGATAGMARSGAGRDVTEEKEDMDEKQGYDAKLDDAEGARHGKKKQDMKQRRADSENMEKAAGKRKFAGDKDMDKMNEELKELRSDLQETNLLNAKLLYTNKIFRAKNLKEAQKVKVLEAFDKASNVKEVKLIFETLNEGMAAKTATKSSIRENLGSASKAAGVAQHRKPIVEIDSQVSRWQKLAGIK